MKKLILGFVILAAVCAQAVEVKQVSAEEKAAQHERMMKATGGLLEVPAEGKVVVVNAQTKIPRATVEAAVADMAKATKFNFEVRDGKVEMYKKPADATGAIVLGECADLPMSVVAAENTWGLLNVTPLISGDAAKDAKRFKCEFVRVATFALGQSVSQYKTSALCVVSKPEDLDYIQTVGLTMDSQMLIMKTLTARGMTQTRKTSYRKACEQGWAPQPTNDYQKAIWKQVHELPTEPLKLTK